MKKGDAMKKILMFFLCGIFFFTACTSKPMEKHQRTFYEAFDTITNVSGYTKEEEVFQNDVDEMEKALTDYHAMFDIYNNYPGINNVKTINDKAGIEPVKVSSEIIDMLEVSKSWYTRTDGKVNVAMGAVLKLWHDARESKDSSGRYVLPTKVDLEEAAKHCNIEDVIIDKEASTVFLKDPKMSLDVGAIAKGYAVEKVAQKMEAKKDKSIILSVGGDVRSIGKPAIKERDVWMVGLQNPDKPEDQTSILAVVAIPEGLSVVTSGDYQRYFEQDGIRYHHLIDPDTLMPGDKFSSVTLICPDSGMGDYLSTALFLSDLETGKKIAQDFDIEAYWVDRDGKVTMTEGFRNYLQE